MNQRARHCIAACGSTRHCSRWAPSCILMLGNWTGQLTESKFCQRHPALHGNSNPLARLRSSPTMNNADSISLNEANGGGLLGSRFLRAASNAARNIQFVRMFHFRCLRCSRTLPVAAKYLNILWSGDRDFCFLVFGRMQANCKSGGG